MNKSSSRARERRASSQSVKTPRPRARPSRFFQVLLAIAVSMHVFFAGAAFEALRRVGAPWPALVAVFLAALGIATFLSRARLMMPDRKRSAVGVVLIDLPFYVHFCAAFFTLPLGLLATLVLPLAKPAAYFPFLMWTYAVGLVLAAYGVLVRRRVFVIDRVEVPIKGLDPKLDGFRIVQLSDLHIGALTPKSWGDRWVAAANRENADLAVVTGDMVTSGVDFHDDIADSLGSLKARLGTFVSMGNHDYFGEGEPLISRLRERGCNVLRNEATTLEDKGARLHLAAADDTWTRRADVDRALANRPQGVPVVLLAHEPALFDVAAENGVALTLSGHTHGGQVAVPFFAKRASLSHLSHKYHLGLYRKGDASLYVHPGLGTTGPPVRLGVAPAVTVLTLRAA